MSGFVDLVIFDGEILPQQRHAHRIAGHSEIVQAAPKKALLG
jgi:hypothetical protein